MRNWVCYYVTGGGNRHVEGEFREIKRTAKILTLELTKEGFFCMYPEHKIRKIPLEGARGTAFCPAVRYHDDGDITVYHNQAGTPFIYSGLKDVSEKTNN